MGFCMHDYHKAKAKKYVSRDNIQIIVVANSILARTAKQSM